MVIRPLAFLLTSLVVPASAAGVRAETLLAGNAGAVFGGYLERRSENLTYGGALTHFPAEQLGFEIDVAHTLTEFDREFGRFKVFRATAGVFARF